MDKQIYKTTNVYLSAFLISQEFFSLGSIGFENPEDSRVSINIEFDPKHFGTLENLIDIYNKGRAVVFLKTYQNNIRFIMKQVNMRKSGITEDMEISSRGQRNDN